MQKYQLYPLKCFEDPECLKKVRVTGEIPRALSELPELGIVEFIVHGARPAHTDFGMDNKPASRDYWIIQGIIRPTNYPFDGSPTYETELLRDSEKRLICAIATPKSGIVYVLLNS